MAIPQGSDVRGKGKLKTKSTYPNKSKSVFDYVRVFW